MFSRWMETGSFGFQMETDTAYRLLYVKTYVRQNAGTFDISLWDNIANDVSAHWLPVSAEWELNDDYESFIADPNWKTDFFLMFFSAKPSWYGGPFQWYVVSLGTL